MQPLLSICIPTYNRAAFLRDTLERIARQISGGIAPQVEIVVSDNASTDDTPQVIAALQAAFPLVCLRSHRQAQNTGPDANIYETVKLARGEFAYILSDDDILLPGAVDKLLGLMREFPEADALTLNIYSFVDEAGPPGPLWYSVAEDMLITNRDEALRALALSHLFLSMTAFRRNLADKDYSAWIGTNLLQSYLFMDVLARGRGLAITAQPFLAQRLTNTGGYGFFKVMVTNYQDLMRYAAGLGFAPAVLREFREKQLRTSVFHFLLRYKMMQDKYDFHLSRRDGIGRLLRAYGLNPFLLLRVIPLLLMPSSWLKRLWQVYRAVKYGRHAAPLPGTELG